MSDIKDAVKKLFANQTQEPRATDAFKAQLAGLDAPSPSLKKIVPAVVASVPAPVVVSVVVPIVQQAVAIPAKELCPHCGQPMPKKIVPIVVSDPSNPDQRPIDWDDEQRTDLPMRTSNRIQFLLKYETTEQTQARIVNDGLRYRHQRALEGLL